MKSSFNFSSTSDVFCPQSKGKGRLNSNHTIIYALSARNFLIKPLFLVDNARQKCRKSTQSLLSIRVPIAYGSEIFLRMPPLFFFSCFAFELCYKVEHLSDLPTSLLNLGIKHGPKLILLPDLSNLKFLKNWFSHHTV